jgi:hypothetical protein
LNRGSNTGGVETTSKTKASTSTEQERQSAELG